MSPRRFTVHLGLAALSFVVPAVWSSCNRLLHPAPAAVTPRSTPGQTTGLLPSCASAADRNTTGAPPAQQDEAVRAACEAAQLVHALEDTH
ncbi:hypothetical protein [Deinococcus radiotolerans]|uniref:Uncharacterized protein n=1 Tax=Deinococcus radiotolerans TaxID=1309407 RepID=A0ABQ2FKG5_9DEIO|nr:hypothetical protein [Deinococcus radiotolerans]GGL06876.1 hypothetical protein GCM10010844_27100 [Deinococcus radiotolerans]